MLTEAMGVVSARMVTGEEAAAGELDRCTVLYSEARPAFGMCTEKWPLFKP